MVETLQGKEKVARPEEFELMGELSFFDRALAENELHMDKGRLMVRADDSIKVVVPRGMRSKYLRWHIHIRWQDTLESAVLGHGSTRLTLGFELRRTLCWW